MLEINFVATHKIVIEGVTSFEFSAYIFFQMLFRMTGFWLSLLPWGHGACGTCAGMVIEGRVGWEELSHLDEVRMSQEFVLLCVSLSLSGCTLKADIDGTL